MAPPPTSRRGSQPPTSRRGSPPEPPFLRTPDELLEEIFIRLPTAADLARVSTASASFRRVIADHAFLRRCHALQSPPLLGMIAGHFIPSQPPHPSAAPARAFAGFDFSCSPFLPSTAGRTWSPRDFFDGCALLANAPADESGVLVGPEVCDFQYREYLARDLAVCDPVHRRYVLLPAVPGDLKALVHRPDVLYLETFLAPGDDEADPLSFRVMCLAQCKTNLLLLVFSTSHGQWRDLTYDQWGAQATRASFQDSSDAAGLSPYRQFVHGCFCWQLHFQKLLLLDTRTMEFSAVDLPPEPRWTSRFFIVEAEDGALGRLAKWYYDYGFFAENFDEDSGDSYLLTYSVLRNNQWHSEEIIPLPAKRAILIGVAGGYLLIKALYTNSSQEELFGYFTVDVKTLRVELFAGLSEAISPSQLYVGFW